MFLSHKVKYTVSFDGVPPYKREELSRRLSALREELREQVSTGHFVPVSRRDVTMTLACPAHGPGFLLAVVRGQQYVVSPPDAWWCLLLGRSEPCEGDGHTCEEIVYGQACTRCGALREEAGGFGGLTNAAGPWLHVGTDEHRGALARAAQGVLCGGRWPLALFADEAELKAVAS